MRVEPLLPSIALIAQRSKAARGKDDMRGVPKRWIGIAQLNVHCAADFF